MDTLRTKLERNIIEDQDTNWLALQRQVSHLQTILEVSRFLNSTLDLDPLLENIIQIATKLTDTEAASILLLDQKRQKLRFEAATGAKRIELKSILVPLEGSIAGWIVTNNQPLLVDQASQDPRHFVQADQLTQFQTQSILGVPLRVKEKTIGVLEVLNKRAGWFFTEQDRQTLETLAAQAAVAIENARLYRALHDQMEARQTVQARLVQSEKLAAVGELVAGVAHELNNPLTAIIGFAEMLRLADLDNRSQEDVNRIVTQGHRAAKIVRSLLDFARQQPSEQKPIQLNDVVRSSLELLAYDTHLHNVTVQTDLQANLPLTSGDPHRLQQVFVNLVHNACQAMHRAHGGGCLTLATALKPAKFDGALAVADPNSAAENLVIRVMVQDDGPGISASQLSRIFNPFFTTKRSGEGTGLGLSVCHGIVNEHGGHIWAESESGQGATFFIELPVVQVQAVAPASPGHAGSACPHGGRPQPSQEARILVVDDETDVLTILLRTLQEAGYRVDAVSDGRVALACLAASNYDLVLCDIRMTGLTGLDVYQEARQQQPDLAQRFIFITGDIVSPAITRFLAETGLPSMDKPFQPQRLLDLVDCRLARR
jgi:two-component system NtrC family sensor kinase